jgi:hypothetical protein
MFLRNIGSFSLEYTMLYPRRYNSKCNVSLNFSCVRKRQNSLHTPNACLNLVCSMMMKLEWGRILVGPLYTGTIFRRNAVSCGPFMRAMPTWENSTTSWVGLSLTVAKHPRLLHAWISNFGNYVNTHSPVGIRVYFAALRNVVGIATGYALDDQEWSSSPSRIKKCLFFTSSRPTLVSTQPPTQRVPATIPQG